MGEIIDNVAMKKLLAIEGKLKFKVQSNSMEPLFRRDDQIAVGPIDHPNMLKRFDIVLHWNGEQYISHFVWKVLKCEPLTFETRALKNYLNSDPSFSTSELIGKVEGFKIPLSLKCKIYLSNWRHHLFSRYISRFSRKN